MDIHRRGFLGLFGALALDPEKLLYVPGKKLISIPSPKKIEVVSNYKGLDPRRPRMAYSMIIPPIQWEEMKKAGYIHSF